MEFKKTLCFIDAKTYDFVTVYFHYFFKILQIHLRKIISKSISLFKITGSFNGFFNYKKTQVKFRLKSVYTIVWESHKSFRY